MRKRRVIICDTDRDLASALSYYFTMRGEYEVLTYHEPLFCPVWASNTDCTNTSPCTDIFIAGSVPGVNGVNLFGTQSRRGCEVSIKNKALICCNFNDNTIKDIMEAGCAIFEKPVDFNKMTAWLHHREQGMDLSVPLKLKRREDRRPANEIVEFIVQPNNKIFRGIAVNTSSSGLCLMTDTSLAQEQSVTMRSPLTPSVRRASVRWVNNMNNGRSLAGLQFVESQT